MALGTAMKAIMVSARVQINMLFFIVPSFQKPQTTLPFNFIKQETPRYAWAQSLLRVHPAQGRNLCSGERHADKLIFP